LSNALEAGAASGLILLDAGPSGQGWSTSEAQLTCPQLAAYNKHPELRDHPDVVYARMADREALVKGSLVHVGTAHHYTAVMYRQNGWGNSTPGVAPISSYYGPVEAVAAAAENRERELVETFGDRNPYAGSWRKHVTLCQDALLAYMAFWANERMRILAVEHRVEVPISGIAFDGTEVSTVHSARIDLIAEEAGRAYMIDSKSFSALWADKRKRAGFALSGQFMGHNLIGRHLYGDQYGGVRINMIGLNPKSKPAERFVRFEPAPAPFANYEFEQQIIDRRALMSALARSGRNPWRYPKALSETDGCMSRYGACSYRSLCSWGPRTGR